MLARPAGAATLALALALAMPAFAGPAAGEPRIELRTAAAYPMKYWLGRPVNLRPEERLPVLVVITDARREFEAAARAFLAAEDALPAGPRVLVVVPVTLTSGGTAQRVKDAFPYDAATWARAGRDGNCTFDDAGIAAVLADVRRVARADDRAYLTGLEAAGHTIFAQAFRHPERWRMVLPVTPNYQARCMDDSAWSADTSRARLPIVVLHGEADSVWAGGMLNQGKQADDAAHAHGFRRFQDRAIPARGHDFLPDAVLALLREAPVR